MNTDNKQYRLLVNLPDGSIIGDTYKKVGDRYFNERLGTLKSQFLYKFIIFEIGN